MLEAVLVLCFLMGFVCVVSKGYIGHQLDALKQRLNDAQHEMQQTADERRQAEGALAMEEDKERRLKAEYQGMADELAEIKKRLARRASGSAPG